MPEKSNQIGKTSRAEGSCTINFSDNDGNIWYSHRTRVDMLSHRITWLYQEKVQRNYGRKGRREKKKVIRVRRSGGIRYKNKHIEKIESIEYFGRSKFTT